MNMKESKSWKIKNNILKRINVKKHIRWRPDGKQNNVIESMSKMLIKINKLEGMNNNIKRSKYN
jgi:hypothetical protein